MLIIITATPVFLSAVGCQAMVTNVLLMLLHSVPSGTSSVSIFYVGKLSLVRGQVTCPRSHSRGMAGQELKSYLSQHQALPWWVRASDGHPAQAQ